MSETISQTATKRAEAHSIVPHATIHTVEADGVQVFYRAAGDANGPGLDPFTWIPGLIGSANSFRAWRLITA